MDVLQASTSDLSEIAELINLTCAGKRHFSPVSQEILSEVLARDPSIGIRGLLVARTAGMLVGATHVFFDSQTKSGYIAYLLSRDPTGAADTRLLQYAEDYLVAAKRIFFGSPYTPLYHAVEGRFQPLWGSTEMLEVSALDTEQLDFLLAKGYRIGETHLSMVLDLAKYEPHSGPSGYRAEFLKGDDCWYNAYSWYRRSSSQEFGLRNRDLRVLLLRCAQSVIGHVAWYPLRNKTDAALCDLEVAAAHRGKGLGKYLLNQGIKHMLSEGFQRVELHVYPKESPVACALYHSSGFVAEATWYVMVKSQTQKLEGDFIGGPWRALPNRSNCGTSGVLGPILRIGNGPVFVA